MELETNGQPLDLGLTLNSGEPFRWREENGWFSNVVRGCFIKIRQHPDGKIEFQSDQSDEFVRDLLHSYFRLDDPIEAIYADISHCPNVAQLVKQYRGLRILRQEPWECLVAYILSVRSSVERTSLNMETLAEHLGDPVSLDGQLRGAFPTPEQVAQADEARLGELLVGFDFYPTRVRRASVEVAGGLLDLEALKRVSSQQATRRLMQCSGIGHKVANCIALFSLDHLDAFPIDRHIARFLSGHYFPGQPIPETGELPVWAALFQEHFGPYAGYAGQFLFHDQRMRG